MSTTPAEIRNHRQFNEYHPYMRLLEAFASAFIHTFGITRPTDKTRSKAAWFILYLLLLVLFGLIAVSFLLAHIL